MSDHNLSNRMLLSHNFDLADSAIPALSKAEFTEIFIQALDSDLCRCCQLLESPHWVVEVQFDGSHITPQELGDRIAEALRNARKSTVEEQSLPHVLALGGLKSTPATSDARHSLQPNEWGVDVVETVNADAFLTGLNWEATIATRAPGTIFQSVLK